MDIEHLKQRMNDISLVVDAHHVLIDELTKQVQQLKDEKKEKLKTLLSGAILDYGCANGWAEEPLLVKECKEKGHITTDRSTKAFGHDNIVWCNICRYRYKYYSS